jgi:fructose-1,6-bisphosphatase/inositol monophosphatase family enzyme
VTSSADRRSDAAVALAGAGAGAAVVRRLYRQPLARYDKSATDFATQADLDAEAAIRSVISAARPTDAFVGEEGGESPGDGTDRQWLVDPLCGTLNYAAGTPLASVNIALVVAGVVTAAAAADPFADEIFWCDANSAWVRQSGIDTPLEPTAASTLVDINCDGIGQFVGPQLLSDPDLLARYGPRVLSTTLALAWIAAGRHAAYISDGDLEGSVHFTAGIALCINAGCVVTDLAGEPVYSGRGLIAAADHDTHHRLAAIVSKYR